MTERILILFINTLLVSALTISSWSAYSEEKHPPFNTSDCTLALSGKLHKKIISKKWLSTIKYAFGAAKVEPQLMAIAYHHYVKSRNSAQQIIDSETAKNHYRSEQLIKDLLYSKTFLLEDPRDFWRKKTIEANAIIDPKVGTGTISIAQLREYFQHKLPPKMAPIAVESLYALLDFQSVSRWLSGVQADILATMWHNGIASKEIFNHQEVRQFYLDLVLAKRAQKNGFIITEEGLPKNLFSFNAWNFYRHLKAGHLFVDWTGPVLYSGKEERPHYARGHLLAMAYLADSVPKFVDLVKYIGQTKDDKKVWMLMFDNANDTSSPFWGGFWVDSFKDYLNIKE